MHDHEYTILRRYIEDFRWALVPLHDVTNGGVCSCYANLDCPNPGKHPRRPAWQEASQLVHDVATLDALWTLPEVRRWNWGVATGPASGVWVLDWDVAHDLEIRQWLTDHVEGDWQDHEIPYIAPDLDTLTLGPTGGGGWHYVFALPPGFTPRGSQTRNRYGLPPGLDVRGHHGQIVVCPSVSGKGPYGGVLLDRPVRRAPAWLEDMLRPAPEVARERPPASSLSLPGLADGGGSTLEASRALSYARSAVAGLLRELATAEPGTRDDTTIRVAYRLIEIANAPWSGFDEETLYDAWVEHRMLAADREAVRGQLPDKWRRARAHVGGLAAELPPGYLGGEHIPFGSGPPASESLGGPEFLDPIHSSGSISNTPVTTTIDVAVDPVADLISRMLTPEQLRKMPPPVPLINGLLDLNTCAWLIGKAGSCKSFVALDFAAHVGAGREWHGRRVHRGLVIYVVAEGAQGMKLRVDAYEREFEPIEHVLFLPEPVPADERRTPDRGAWSVLVEACRRLEPALVILDTQARVTVGLNENDNAEMGYYAEQAGRIRRATGACVLTVHHLGRSGTNARGASAIDGAQDAELRVERQDGSLLLKLHTDKQKDQADAPPVPLVLRVSDGGVDPETGRDLSSLVVCRPDHGPFQDPTTSDQSGQPAGQRRMIALYQLIMDRYQAGDGGTKAEIKKAFLALPEIAALPAADSRDRAWTRAWNGTPTMAGLVPRGLIAQRAGAARFKVVEIERQESEGVLTPNDFTNPTLPPDGWNLYLPDNEPR